MNHPALPQASRRRLGIFLSAASLGLMVLCLPNRASTHPASAHPARPQPASALQAGWTLLEDAEDPRWPASSLGLWSAAAGVPGPAGTTSMAWTSSPCQAKHGARALRAFGRTGGAASTELPCASAVPSATVATAVLNLDLRNARLASRLELDFDVWLGLAAGGRGALSVLLRVPQPDGKVLRVPVLAVSGSGAAWIFPQRTLDLINLIDVTKPGKVYDLRGGQWQLEWVADAPDGAPPGGGIYVDDVYLIWEPAAAFPTPTPRPAVTILPATPVPATATPPPATRSPTPSPTATSSPSRTPTRSLPATDEPTSTPPSAGSATPTGTPPDGNATPHPPVPLYLPLAVRDYPEPTATPTETATPVETATETATAMATPPSDATATPVEETATPGRRLR